MKRNHLKMFVCTLLAAVLTLGAGTLGAGAAQIDLSAVGEGETPAVQEDDSLPAAYSSRDLGYVTSVKSQDFNSCWAYAGLATLESALLRRGFYTEDMSPVHMNLWATTRSDGTGWQREVSSDGYPSIALGYFTAWHGGVFQSAVSDLSLFGGVTGDDVPTDLTPYCVTGVRYLNRDEPDVIKRCIMDFGGVYTSYAHTAACMTTDRMYYYMPPGYTGSYAGHSVEVIGWDDDFPRESFREVSGSIPSQNGAWLIKSSWGENNALGGCFWMSYEDRFVFAKKYFPSYAIVGIEQMENGRTLLQNEIYGASYEFLYNQTKTRTFINRFTFDGDHNALSKVIFETRAAGANYTVYYVPDGEGETPDPDQTRWTKLCEGSSDYAGYICADVGNFICPDAAGSVAVTLDTRGTDSFATLGVCEWLVSSDDSYVFRNKSSRGESFLVQDGQIVDLMDWYKTEQNDDLGGTFVIKAVAAEYYPPTLRGDANLDGLVDINDVTEIQRHVAEFLTLEKTAAANADYDGDGVITIGDATQIQFYLAEY